MPDNCNYRKCLSGRLSCLCEEHLSLLMSLSMKQKGSLAHILFACTEGGSTFCGTPPIIVRLRWPGFFRMHGNRAGNRCLSIATEIRYDPISIWAFITEVKGERVKVVRILVRNRLNQTNVGFDFKFPITGSCSFF